MSRIEGLRPAGVAFAAIAANLKPTQAPPPKRDEPAPQTQAALPATHGQRIDVKA